MKLYGEVEIRNMLVSSANIRSNKKTSKACISIGKKSLKDSAGSLLICTHSNKSGVNYKLQNNVERVFNKFVHEGKCTIRTKEPNHEILISKADPIALKSFLAAIKCCFEGKQPSEGGVGFLTPASTNELYSMKKSMVIQSKLNYPVTTNFPTRLEQLVVSCGLRTVDSRMLALKYLVTLDLSNNNIRKIPDNWDGMLTLSSLILSGNQIDELPKSFLRSRLKSQLSFLSLSNNQLTFLPRSICDFGNLLELKVSKNKLTCLPHDIFHMSSLQTLDVSDNRLQFLPESRRGMALNCLDVSGNQELSQEVPSVDLRGLKNFPTLEELSSRAVLDRRVHYTEMDVSFLVKYSLDVLRRNCLHCSRHCIEHRAVLLKPLSLLQVSLASLGMRTALTKFFLCSNKCLEAERLKLPDLLSH